MYNSSVSASERRRRAIEALQAVGLGDRLEHKSNQMSGGIVHQGAGDGYALHLTAGHLIGLMFQSVAQPHVISSPKLLPLTSGRLAGKSLERNTAFLSATSSFL